MKRLLFVLITLTISLGPLYAQNSDAHIREIITRHSPLGGGKIPSDIKDRLGSTHVGGKYHLTNEPFIIEGSRKLAEMGYGVLKLWFRKNPSGYPYNSSWNVPKDVTLAELAKHPYYVSCFDQPFTTIALSVDGAGIRTTDETAKAEEEEIYELTKHLLQTYRQRDLTFILHNWEGDWMLRGGTGDAARWSRKPGELIRAVDGDRYTVVVPGDSLVRINAMIKWFQARQRGVERARLEVSDSKCKVYHAIEANKVVDSMEGIPGIVNYVVPKVKVDMVSWSCYDALTADGILLYKGIEYIRQNIEPSPYMKGQRVVFLGEIGIPEQRYEDLQTEAEIVRRWDTQMAVVFALEVPLIIHWELYCNEPKESALRNVVDTRTKDEMRGFWLIRPDGTKSFAAEYFDKLLRHAGGTLPSTNRNVRKD